MASQGIFNFLVSGNPEGAICISCYLLRFKKLNMTQHQLNSKNNGSF